MYWLGRALLLTSRLYHCIHQGLRKWPQEFQGLARSLHVDVHLLAGYLHHLLLRVDEQLGCLPRQLGQLGLLDFLDGGVLPPVTLAVSSAMTSRNCFCALAKFSIPSRARLTK